MQGHFHWRDGNCFRRLDDGSVEVFRKLKHDSPEEKIFVIDRTSWASIVASVSEKGEGDGRFYEALRFHGEPEDAEPKMLAP